jgi:PEP-CTERM motif
LNKRKSKVKKQILVIGVCLAASVTLMLNVRAATVIWDSVGSITDVSDVSTQGIGLQAYNLGNSGFSSTINGVTFTSTAVIGSGPYSVGSGAGSLTFIDSVVEQGGFGFLGSGGGPQGALDNGYQTMLGSGIYNGINPMTLTISGLTASRDYLVQFWVSDSRNIGVVWSRSETFTAGNTSDSLDYNVQNSDGGLGQYVIGRFTADAVSQNILVNSATFQLNGYQIRDITAIPEPSTVALLAMGSGLMLAAFRRRHVNLE